MRAVVVWTSCGINLHNFIFHFVCGRTLFVVLSPGGANEACGFQNLKHVHFFYVLRFSTQCVENLHSLGRTKLHHFHQLNAKMLT